jgi:polyisoprenyl-phosphate glycosyltransferase
LQRFCCTGTRIVAASQGITRADFQPDASLWFYLNKGYVQHRQTTDLVSLILPAYNEESNIRAVYESIQRALQGFQNLEIIFVDDGSSDGTAACVRQLRSEDSSVRLVRFGRNFGHQSALFAGLQAARGSAVITLDCDLQHPPELLPQMLQAWRSGARVVQTVRLQTSGVSWFKRLSSKCFYLFINLLSEVPLVSGAVDYLLLDREVVEEVLRFKDRQPFLRGLVAWLGFTPVRFEYVAPPRTAGKSGYSLAKMLRLAVNAITGLSSKPLRFSLYLGCLTALFCLAYSVFAVVQFAAGRTIQGWTSVIMTVTFLGAVQLVSVGVLGEYIARIFEQTRGMPRFVIVECDEPAAMSEEPEHAAYRKNPA